MKHIFSIVLFMLTLITVNYSQSIIVTYPNGGEFFINNTWSPHNITWETVNVSSVDIEYSINNGTDWTVIENNYSEGEYYSWDIPDIDSDACLIRVSESGGGVSDESDAVFSIDASGIYVAEWTTTMGNFRAELRGDLAPMTVQNFMNLAQKGFYQDLIFHRVISNFMIQDGCPFGTGFGGPGYSFDDEFHPLLRHSHPGILSMANAGPNTNGSQYFITVEPTAWLDDAHSVFGRIIDNMNIVYEISEVDTDANDKPLVDIVLSIEIVESTPLLNVVYPSEGMYLESGRTVMLEWESDFIADVMIELSTNNGSDWITIIDSIPADNELTEWIVPEIVSDECLIRISDIRDNSVYGMNSSVFTIREKPVELSRLEFFENVNAPINNPENRIQTGKDFNFKLNIENMYVSELQDLTISVVSDNEEITFVNDNSDFALVPVASTAWSNSQFEIQTSEDFPTTGQYSFSVFGAASNVPDEFWLGDFNIPVLKKFPFITIDDDDTPDSNGNGNGDLEPDETIELEVPIDNKSDETLYEVFGKLISDYNSIHIWNNEEGVDGMVYDSVIYNGGDPILPNASAQNPDNDFVFNYNASDIYYIELLLEINGYLYEEAGSSWDDGGVYVKWGIPVVLNSSFPVDIDENQIEYDRLFKLNANLIKNSLRIQMNEDYVHDQNQINITDLQGRIIYSERMSFDQNELRIDLSNLRTGLYFIHIGHQTEKFIVVK